jgi:hypothetical protein
MVDALTTNLMAGTCHADDASAEGPPPRRPSNFVSGLESTPIRVTPTAREGTGV